MISPGAFLHSLAVVEPGAQIGSRTRVWQYCVILSGAVVGEDCNICAQCLIEGGATVGSRVTVKSGVQLWDGVTLEDDVFAGPNVTFTNDRLPRSRRCPPEFARTRVCQGASLGANATILPGVTIGSWAMIGAGAVVTRTVSAHALVLGNPARLAGWVCRCGEKLRFNRNTNAECACGRRFLQSSASSIKALFP
jgi:UDP-2-acetamido-3-amino-2,3-dideoxy-glucuronate N-acetyltransferase